MRLDNEALVQNITDLVRQKNRFAIDAIVNRLRAEGKTYQLRDAFIYPALISGTSLVHIAAQGGNTDLVVYLLHLWEMIPKYSDDPADMLSYQDADGNTPLHVAIQNNQWEVLHGLIAYAKDIDIKQPWVQQLVRHWDATWGRNTHRQTECHAFLNIQNYCGSTAAHIAAQKTQEQGYMYSKLKEQGADLTIKDNDEKTAQDLQEEVNWQLCQYPLEKTVIGASTPVNMQGPRL